MEKQISSLERRIKLSDEAHTALSGQVKKIESKKNQYSVKIKELEENEKTKNILDTRLPDDLKRLLHDSIQTD